MEKEKNKIHVTNHTFCQNDKRYEVLKTNLPSEHKQMHKFTEVASGERQKSTSLPTLCVRMIKRYALSNEKVNLPPEHQQMRTFTEVASGEREKSTSLPILCVRMIKRYA